MTVYDVIDQLQHVLDDDGLKRPRRVLEAGCGSTSYLKLRTDDHIVGIDISEKQLGRNVHLDEKILGDLQTYPLPRESFDVVVCWYVLEHLPQPEQALANMIACTKPGGILVIAVPYIWSFKGMVTKLTPHWFHVFVHRYIFRRKNAGVDDQPPFPTFLRRSISMRALMRAAKEQSLEVSNVWRFEDYTQRKLRTRSALFRGLYRSARSISAIATLNLWDMYLTDFAIVLRRTKEGNAAA